MGEIRNYHCDCGYEARIFAGSGMRAHSALLAKQMFPDVISEGDKADCKGKVFLDNALAECERCKELKSVARLRYGSPVDSCNYFLKDICNKCNEKMFIHENEENVRCPKCGQGMKYTRTGMWD